MSLLVISDLTLQSVKAASISAAVKHGNSKVLLNPDMPHVEKLAALMEEVGEVAQLLTYDKLSADRLPLVKELLQVANLAAAWAECEDQLQAAEESYTAEHEHRLE